MNPEFRRNLWLELTPQRLLLMPVILGLVFFAVGQTDSWRGDSLVAVAQPAFFLLVLLWGCRRAAASLGDELREATWDSQRMSAIGPWAMSWGKLLGSTIFIWYGGLICLAAIAYGLWRANIPVSVGLVVAKLVVAGLLGQMVSFATALAWLRKTRPTRRLPIGLCLTLGVALGYGAATLEPWLLTSAMRRPSGDLLWFSWSIPMPWFYAASLLIFALWALLAVYRLMQAELQVKQRPWAWPAFSLYSMVFAVGLADGANWDCDRSGPTLVLLPVAYGVALLLCYVIVFLDAKDPVRWRAFLAHGRAGAWRAALTVTPSWLVGSLIALLVGGLALLGLNAAPLNRPWPDCLTVVDFNPVGIQAFLLSSLAFLLRDIGLILVLNLGRWRHRADQAGLIYLVLLYGLVPFALQSAGLDGTASLFYPTAQSVSAASALVQAVLALAFLAWYWRRLETGFRRNLSTMAS